jgi:hypothetical protein
MYRTCTRHILNYQVLLLIEHKTTSHPYPYYQDLTLVTNSQANYGKIILYYYYKRGLIAKRAIEEQQGVERTRGYSIPVSLYSNHLDKKYFTKRSWRERYNI